MDAISRCVRAAGMSGAIGLLLLASAAATISLLYVLPAFHLGGSSRVSERMARQHHGPDGRNHDLVAELIGALPLLSLAPVSPPRNGHTMPPGEWVWSDVRAQRSARREASSAVQTERVTLAPSARNGGDREGGAGPSRPECGACAAGTAGPCRHVFLPICFEINTSTGACPSETTRCRDGTFRTAAAASQSHGGRQNQNNQRKRGPSDASMPGFVFVTAASANHFCPLLNMLHSLHVTSPDIPVIVYDLETPGGERLDRTAMARVHRNILRTDNFDYTGVPSWFDINVRAGEYAWKPIIIKRVVDEFGSALWVDSGNLAAHNLNVDNVLHNLIGPHGFYSPRSQQTPWHWVHPGTFAHFGMIKCCADPSISTRRPCCCCGKSIHRCDTCDDFEGKQLQRADATFWLNKTMCNGALIGFARGTPGYESVLVPWAVCALNRSCIAPLGPGGASHRGNHRQDQSALTMLSHVAGMPCVDRELSAGFRLHQDNRWTNKTFCADVLSSTRGGEGMMPDDRDSYGHGDNTPRATLSEATTPPSGSSVLLDKMVRQQTWVPKTPRTDLLSKECLADVQSHKVGATGVAKGQRRDVDLTHIINPFPTSDVHFHWTLPAIIGAHRRAQEAGLNIEVLAFTFEDEELEGVWPDFVTVLPILWPNRTAGAHLERLGVEFDKEEKPLWGPIVSDVWDAAYDHARGRTLIWTNFDLIVAPEFYTEIVANLADPAQRVGIEGLVGYSSLRLDLIIPRDRFPTLDGWTVNDFFEWNETKAQAGHDTFVFPRRWIPCLEKADLAFGVGGWDHSVYSQMKWLASLEGKQFRTLSPGRGLPSRGLVRHIGSQIANADKVWTNPVSWKGPARVAQYNFNKRQKASVEIFLKMAMAGSNMCRKRRVFGTCKSKQMASAAAKPASTKVTSPLARAPNNDYRLVGLAIPSPNAAVSSLIEHMTGFYVVSAHNASLTVIDRNEAMMVVTHAADLFPGPKPVNLAIAQPAPAPGKKGRILRFRAVAVVLDRDPVAAVVASARMAETTGVDTMLTRSVLAPHVARYTAFWSFWAGKARGSSVAVELFNLNIDNSTRQTLELTILHEFLVYMRCGPSQQAQCHHPTGDGFGVCCASSQLASPLAFHQGSDGVVAPDVAEWIQKETKDAVDSAHKQWEAQRSRFPWPNLAWDECCL